MIEILQKERKELRRVAEEVREEEIGTPKIKLIIERMQNALAEQEDGVAIAAPQIGENLRIFVMSKRVEEMSKGEKNSKDAKDKIFINPKLVKVSKEKEMMDEGCLSVRYLYGKVLRSKKATVEALDENGKKFRAGGSGIAAQIFQHETDHLDGVLFIDEATDLEEIPPEKLKKAEKKL
jgi:peptide deformylase